MTTADTTDWLTWTEPLAIGDMVIPVTRARRIHRTTATAQTATTADHRTAETVSQTTKATTDTTTVKKQKEKTTQTTTAAPSFCIWLTVFFFLALAGVVGAIILKP